MTTLHTKTTVDGAVLRATLRSHAAGVTVITVPGPAGFTATSFTSVSLDPPLVSFCLGLGASTAPAVRAADRFAVHILSDQQQWLAAGFARSGVDRFAGVDWEDADGLPLIQGVPAVLHCSVVSSQDVGDHVLVIGEVIAVDGAGADAALVHHGGSFAGTVALS